MKEIYNQFNLALINMILWDKCQSIVVHGINILIHEKFQSGDITHWGALLKDNKYYKSVIVKF